MKEILLNIESKETRYALLRNGQLQDLIVERKRARQVAGNVYRGQVTNILHNIQSAFIDIAEGENGFIHIDDILENTKKFEAMFDMDFELDYDISEVNTNRQANLDIEQLLKIDQAVLVQVVKEPIGTKGARLTSKISLPGRYLVLLPNTPHFGVSRKIEERSGRDKLKSVVRGLKLPKGMGLICRTASANATPQALQEEAEELVQTWQAITEKFNSTTGSALLYEESDLVKRAVMTAVDQKCGRLLIDDYPTFQRCKRIYQKYASEAELRIEYYRDKAAMFERFNVEREIDRAVGHKIWLPGGGYLFFERTEAMYTIDVNSGRSGKNDPKSNVEETLVRINMAAAEEIARQLRIRNVGGLVICDFIDMRSRKNRRRVLDCLRDAMKSDTAKCTILGMSEFGLVEMTRQRSRESLEQTIFRSCPYCNGSGLIKNDESVVIEIERALRKAIQIQQQFALRLVCHPLLLNHINGKEKRYLASIAEEENARIEFAADDRLHLNQFEFVSSINEQKIEV